MKVTKKVLLGITISALLVVSVIGVAFATEQVAPAAAEKARQVGYGLCSGTGSIFDVITEKLGITREQIQEERQSGKSLAEIAGENDVDTDELKNEIKEVKKQFIEEKVAEGVIDSERAERMLERMEERIQSRLENDEGQFGFGKQGNNLSLPSPCS